MRLLRPATLPWLVAHELRLFARQRSAGTGRARWIAFGVALLALAGAALSLALSLRRAPPHLDPAVLTMIDAGLIAIMLLMMSQALMLAVATFHDRGDLELLVPSPIAPRVVFAAKLAGIAVATATTFVLIAALFVLPLALLVDARWLLAVVVLAALAVVAAAGGAALAALLFRLVGPRRTKTAAQILGAVMGASFFLLSQVSQYRAAPGAGRVLANLGRHSFGGHLLSRAATGDWRALLILLALAAAIYAAVSALVADRFAGASAQDSGARRTPGKHAARFPATVWGAIVAKEVRLILRDGNLLFQVLLRGIYILPLLLPFARRGVFPASTAAAAITMFAAQLAGSFAWLTLCAEDAPDLIAAAPVEVEALRRAKMAAALAMVAGLAAVPLVALAAKAPLAGLGAALCGAAAAISAVLLQRWYGKPQKRDAFRTRRASSIFLGLAEVLLSLCWAAAAGLMASGSPWAALPAILAVAGLFADTERKAR